MYASGTNFTSFKIMLIKCLQGRHRFLDDRDNTMGYSHIIRSIDT